MGSVEDGEPLAKRVKIPPTEFLSITKNSQVSEVIRPFGGSMVGHFHSSNGKEEISCLEGIVKRGEFVRIVTEALYSLGYERSGALLEEESGICLHSRVTKSFKNQLLDGNWTECLGTLRKMNVMDESVVKSVTFLILEQKFFELIQDNQLMDALNTLRSEIAPVCIDERRIIELSACVISPSQCTCLGFDHQDADLVNSRLILLKKLHKLLPPSVMVPERRLEYLIEQALRVQKEACSYHNTVNNLLSLYSDHQCGKSQIPSSVLQVLDAHTDGVWYVQFSNNGKYLASGSKDCSSLVWEVNGNGELTLKHTLIGHNKPVLMVAWSPDDSMLLTCGVEELVRKWNVCSGDCIQIYEKVGIGMISCGWFPDGKRVITGLVDKSMSIWDVGGQELEYREGLRTIKISDVAVTTDSKWIITICKETALVLFNEEAKTDITLVEEHPITSFSLSRDDKFLLVNLKNQEVHLWSIADDFKLVMKYKGHKRSRYVIRSCLGGSEQSFVASGSEDSQVYIWLRSTGELTEVLPGHSGCVNSVSWNPANPQMLASASDDHTIRIWGIHDAKRKDKEVSHTNGFVINSNGNCKCK